MEEWKSYKLGDIASVQTGPFGSQLHNEDYVNNGTPIVTVEHLGARVFTTQNLPMVSSEDKERLIKYSLKEGDIVFSRVGSVDRCSYVGKAQDGWLFSGRCLRVRAGETINPLFLYYYFQKDSVKQEIRSVAVGATMPSINTKLLSELSVMIPSLKEQKRIAEVLSSIDDIIELNNRINHNLEQQARALYKSWFVDFEPFRGDEFVDSELGLIPAEWFIRRAEDICSINIGKTPPRKETQWFSLETTDPVWVSISDMSDCGVFIDNSAEKLTCEAIKRFNVIIVPEDSILLSFKLTIGRVAIANRSLTTNEAIARFVTNNKALSLYLYLTLLNYDYSRLGSTSSIATAVNSKIVKAMPILWPGKDVVARFAESIMPFFGEIKKRQAENRNLTALRDAMLPKLMTGQLSC